MCRIIHEHFYRTKRSFCSIIQFGNDYWVRQIGFSRFSLTAALSDGVDNLIGGLGLLSTAKCFARNTCLVCLNRLTARAQIVDKDLRSLCDKGFGGGCTNPVRVVPTRYEHNLDLQSRVNRDLHLLRGLSPHTGFSTIFQYESFLITFPSRNSQ